MVFHSSCVGSMLHCLPRYFAVCSFKSKGAVLRQFGTAVAMRQIGLTISGTETVEVKELIGKSLTVRPTDRKK